MKKIIAIAALSLVVFAHSAYSQQPGYVSFQYSMGFGSGDMADFISAPSFRGALVEYRQAVQDNLLVGFDLGWNVFYEKRDYATYTRGTEALSGVQYRYQNAIPILISADYLFSSENTFKPYAGLGIGTMYTERSTAMNLYTIEENTWHFAVKPEIGFLYELSYSTSFKVSAKYYHGFKSGKMDAAQGYFSLGAGLAFNL
jgi:outer membrane protein W